MPLVRKMNSKVPMPFMKRTMPEWMPNRMGTSTDAPNMAKTCWMLRGTSCAGGTFSST